MRGVTCCSAGSSGAVLGDHGLVGIWVDSIDIADNRRSLQDIKPNVGWNTPAEKIEVLGFVDS